MKGRYAVANKEHNDAIKIGGIAHGSPGRKAKIKVDANAVLVIATLIPAAVHKTQIWSGIQLGRNQCSVRPKEQPAIINGKMYPPRSPPATVKEIATSFATPTMREVHAVFISRPV
jgi:hypothetical protein